MSKRNNPILETLCTVPGFPTALKMYKVPASSYWWVRWFDSETKKRIIKSTKEEEKPPATKFAKEFFYDLLRRKDTNQPLTTANTSHHAFEKVCRSLLTEETIKANDKNRDKGRPEETEPRSVKDTRWIIEKDVLPFFRDIALKDITLKKITEYFNTLKDRKLSGSTRHKHRVTINKIMRHACEQELLDKTPLLPKFKAKSKSKDWFSESQYETLKAGIAQAIKDGVVAKDVTESGKLKGSYPITEELRMLCSFMVSSFLRVTDIKFLKHSQIEVKQKGKNRYLLIDANKKDHEKSIVTLDSAVGIYEDLLEMHKGHTAPDDFVWYPTITNRDTAWRSMNTQLNYVLEATKLKTAANGDTRSLGSLRHTCITFAILHSYATKDDIAANARTSTKMIDEHYGRHLKPEMIVDRIQSKRKNR